MCMCSMLNSLAAVERENTSALEVFVCACFLSPLPPALYTEAASLLSGKRPYVIGDRVKSMWCILHMSIYWVVKLFGPKGGHTCQLTKLLLPRTMKKRRFVSRLFVKYILLVFSSNVTFIIDFSILGRKGVISCCFFLYFMIL